MGLFTSKWKRENKQKREKRLDRLDVGEPAVIARDASIPREQRLAAIDRMDEEQLLALLRDRTAAIDYGIGWAAVQRLEQSESLAAVALDQELDEGVRHAAMKRVDDENVLTAYAHDETAGYRSDAIARMHTGALIVQTGLEIGCDSVAASRVEELGDDENLRWLLLHSEQWDSWNADRYVKRYARDLGFIKQIYHEACSETLRVRALRELKRQGLFTQHMREEARVYAGELIEKHGNPVLIRYLLECAEPLGALLPVERDYFYAALRKNPLDKCVLEALSKCDDPAGHAFMPLYETFWRKTRQLDDDDLALVLDVPEDFALDYLKAFIARGSEGNATLGGPASIISTAARTIHLMHANGRACERIEQELPKRERLSIDYQYQDSENDIRDSCDEFVVSYWD